MCVCLRWIYKRIGVYVSTLATNCQVQSSSAWAKVVGISPLAAIIDFLDIRCPGIPGRDLRRPGGAGRPCQLAPTKRRG